MNEMVSNGEVTTDTTEAPRAAADTANDDMLTTRTTWKTRIHFQKHSTFQDGPRKKQKI